MSNLLKKINQLSYNNDNELLQHEQKKNMDKFIIQAALGSAYTLMTTGVFLSGYLIYLGASDELVSYVAVIGSVCGIFMMFFANWIQSKEHRRGILLLINFTSKIFTISSVFVPLIFPKEYWTILSFFLIVIGFIFASINGIIFNTWFVEIVPSNIRGRFFGVRHMFTLIVNLIIPILASIFLDITKRSHFGFFSIFIVAGILGIIELYFFSKIDDVTINSPTIKNNLINTIKIPLSNKPFMNFMMKACLFHLFFFTAATFHQVYLIKYLKLSYTFINLISTISPLLQVFFFLKIWGIITDKLSSNFVYTLSSILFAIDMLLWFFVKTSTMYFILPLIYINGAIEWSGFNISIFNRKYEFFPSEDRVVCDAFYSFCLGITLFVSPLLGKYIRESLSNINFIKSFEFGDARFLFLLSSVSLFIFSIWNILDIKKTDKNDYLFKKSSYIYSLSIIKRVFRFKF